MVFCWCTAGRPIANGFKMCRLWPRDVETQEGRKSSRSQDWVSVRDVWFMIALCLQISAELLARLEPQALWCCRNLDVIAFFLNPRPELVKFGISPCQSDEQQAKHQLTNGSLWCCKPISNGRWCYSYSMSLHEHDTYVRTHTRTTFSCSLTEHKDF